MSTTTDNRSIQVPSNPYETMTDPNLKFPPVQGGNNLVSTIVSDQNSAGTIPITTVTTAAGGIPVTTVQSAVGNILIPAEQGSGKDKYKILSTTANSAIDKKFKGEAYDEFCKVYDQIVEIVEKEPDLDPNIHGDTRPWWTSFKKRHVYYYNENGERIIIPFDELSLGVPKDAGEDVKKAKQQEFAVLVEKATDILTAADMLGAPCHDTYSYQSPFSPQATQPLQTMTMAPDSKGSQPSAVNDETLDRLVEARKKQIDNGKGDAEEKTRRKAMIDARREQLKEFHGKMKKGLQDSVNEPETEFSRILKDKLEKMDEFAAYAAVIMAPMAEEIAEEKEPGGVYSPEKAEKLKIEHANHQQAILCKQALTDALVDAKNGEGIYDKRSKWRKKLAAPYKWMQDHKWVKKYDASSITKPEQDYIERVAELITGDKPESLEWQLVHAVSVEKHHILWTRLLQPLRLSDLSEFNQ